MKEKNGEHPWGDGGQMFLEIRFGEEYLAYKNATRKWVPIAGKGARR